MTTITWENAVSGDWSDASDWTPSTVPGPGSDVVISAIAPTGASPPNFQLEQEPYDISLSTATTIRSLTLDGSGAVLDANGAHLAVRKYLVNGVGNIVDLENRSVASIRGSLFNDGLVELDDTTGSHGSRLAVGGNLVNDGEIDIAADGSDNGRSSVTVAGTLINRGLVDVGGESMDKSVSITVGGYAGLGELSLTGAQGHKASLIVDAVAPTALQGFIWLAGDALMQFSGGAITTIGVAGGLALIGPDAEIAVAGASGDTSAITGLTLNHGEFLLSDGASYATASGVDFRNNGAVEIAALSVPGGNPALVSSLSIGGNFINNNFTTIGDAFVVNSFGGGGNATLTVAGTIVNNGIFTLSDPSDATPASATANAVLNNDQIGITGGTLTVAGDLKNFSEVDVGTWFPPTYASTPASSSSLIVDGTFYNLDAALDVGGPYVNAPVTASLGALDNQGFVGVGGASDATASLTVIGATNNQGTIFAIDGSATLLGDVTGNGTAEIGGDGTIEFGGASSNAVSFDDVTGTLKLDTAQSFTGLVAGLTQGDGIDLANFDFADGAKITDVSGPGKINTLTRVTIADGALNVTLRLLNSYAGEFAVNASAYTLTADNATANAGTLFQLAASLV